MRKKLASIFFDRGVLPNLSNSLGSDFWAGRSLKMRGINLKGAHEAAQALDLFWSRCCPRTRISTCQSPELELSEMRESVLTVIEVSHVDRPRTNAEE